MEVHKTERQKMYLLTFKVTAVKIMKIRGVLCVCVWRGGAGGGI